MKIVIAIFVLMCMLGVSARGQAKKAEPLKPEEIEMAISVKTDANLTVRYIANEGVLIAASGKQVLIDGLHREYQPA